MKTTDILIIAAISAWVLLSILKDYRRSKSALQGVALIAVNLFTLLFLVAFFYEMTLLMFIAAGCALLPAIYLQVKQRAEGEKTGITGLLQIAVLIALVVIAVVKVID